MGCRDCGAKVEVVQIVGSGNQLRAGCGAAIDTNSFRSLTVERGLGIGSVRTLYKDPRRPFVVSSARLWGGGGFCLRGGASM